jgi:hypothetical protein
MGLHKVWDNSLCHVIRAPLTYVKCVTTQIDNISLQFFRLQHVRWFHSALSVRPHFMSRNVSSWQPLETMKFRTCEASSYIFLCPPTWLLKHTICTALEILVRCTEWLIEYSWSASRKCFSEIELCHVLTHNRLVNLALHSNYQLNKWLALNYWIVLVVDEMMPHEKTI